MHIPPHDYIFHICFAFTPWTVYYAKDHHQIYHITVIENRHSYRLFSQPVKILGCSLKITVGYKLNGHHLYFFFPIMSTVLHLLNGHVSCKTTEWPFFRHFKTIFKHRIHHRFLISTHDTLNREFFFSSQPAVKTPSQMKQWDLFNSSEVNISAPQTQYLFFWIFSCKVFDQGIQDSLLTCV